MLPAQGLVLRYFGTKLRTDAPEWREDWSNAARLPDLLGVEFMPAPTDAPLPAVIIGLRFAQ
jgi:hypothetical protein